MKLEGNFSPSDLVFSHLNKIFWPKEKYAKGDVIEYYRKIVPVILPYLKDRPESLNRHPGGIAGPDFYQKNVGRENLPVGSCNYLNRVQRRRGASDGAFFFGACGPS